MTMPAAKAELRSDLLRRRSAIGPEPRHRTARRLADIGLDLVESFVLPHPPIVSAYFPMRDEVDTLPLLAVLAKARIAIGLPVTVARAQPLRFLSWRPGESLRHGRYGVMEPPAEAPELAPDILFVPLAGFDARGFRLGYGAGYYDATLAGLRRARRVLAVGVAFSVQEVARVPAEPHDEPLDAVVTEHGLRHFGTL